MASLQGRLGADSFQRAVQQAEADFAGQLQELMCGESDLAVLVRQTSRFAQSRLPTRMEHLLRRVIFEDVIRIDGTGVQPHLDTNRARLLYR